MIRRPPRSTRKESSAASDVYKRQVWVQGEMKEEHWITINRARAIENGCYVIAPDHVGNIYCGRSLVVDPFGRILLDMGQRQGIGYADIDTRNVQKTRRILPLLKNRRTDVYQSPEY